MCGVCRFAHVSVCMCLFIFEHVFRDLSTGECMHRYVTDVCVGEGMNRCVKVCGDGVVLCGPGMDKLIPFFIYLLAIRSRYLVTE